MRISKIVAGLGVCLSVSACGFADLIGSSRAYNYATITHASEHVNATKQFNEVNPGLGIGSEAPFRGSDWSVGVEAGAFKNSNYNISPYAVGYVEKDMIPSRSRALRIGAFGGYARYPAEAARNQNKFPVFGDYIPVMGLQATVPTFGPHEFRVRVSPGLNRSSAIITLQSNFVF